jgi:two-component system cell cycle response regulator
MVAERIRQRIGSLPFFIAKRTRTLEVTVSIGVASRETLDSSPSAMLKRADLALYRAKHEGRNRVIAAAA